LLRGRGAVIIKNGAGGGRSVFLKSRLGVQFRTEVQFSITEYPEKATRTDS